MADALDLQDIDVAETPADTYHSANSIYACIRMSHFSVAC